MPDIHSLETGTHEALQSLNLVEGDWGDPASTPNADLMSQAGALSIDLRELHKDFSQIFREHPQEALKDARLLRIGYEVANARLRLLSLFRVGHPELPVRE